MCVYKTNASETKSPYTARLATVLDKTLNNIKKYYTVYSMINPVLV